MGHLQKVVAAMLSIGLLGAPAWAAPAPAVQLGIVVYADHARLGTGSASVGTTVFGGDKLSTEPSGSVQVRAGAARLLLASSSVATLSLDDASPTATLTAGTATFSTANSKAFVLHFASAAIRPNTDEPTVGQVSAMGAREFVVKSTRGSLLVTVAGESRVVAEGSAYHVILNPTPEETAAASSPAGGKPAPSGPPVSAGTSKFVWYAAGVVAAVTIFAVSEALESPDRP
ncbi:MAG TPA: hypothetical protein VKF79_09690 [Candidatus Acidoferrum sp.]|nr:hypothetical protein [Candidatus Acidoferrum sp.]